MKLKNNICPHCNGRGYDFKAGHIISRRDGSIIANTFSRGDNCGSCRGTGKARYQLTAWGCIVLAVSALAATAFAIQPLLHIWLDSAR